MTASRDSRCSPVWKPARRRPKNGEVTGEVDYVDSVEFSVDIVVILKML